VGDVDEDSLSNEVMDSLVNNIVNLSQTTDFDVLFGGISEIPSNQSLRGRWWHAWLNMLTRKAKDLGDKRITYCDVITPSSLDQIHFKEVQGKRFTREPPALVAERIVLLERAIQLYLSFGLSHQLLGRAPLTAPVEQNTIVPNQPGEADVNMD
jgi:hypothetical protein